MVEDILKSTKEQLLERISSPIIGSFVIAWSLWNYKFFVILFSANTATQTFNLINQIVFPTTGDLILRGILAPALTAAAYIFIYPHPALYVFKYTKERQREQNIVRQQIENETLLSKEESIKIYSEIRKADAAHREEVERLNTEIQRLREALKTKTTADTAATMMEVIQNIRAPDTNTDESDSSTSGPVESELTPKQYELLKEIENAGGFMKPDALRHAFGAPSVQTDFDIQELVDKGYIHKEYSAKNSATMYQFLQPGRRALLEETQRRASLSKQGKNSIGMGG